MLLILGDNLEAMRLLQNGIVDLVCLSPPMHVGELDDWNTPLSALFTKDCWAWDSNTEINRIEINRLAKSKFNADYAVLEQCLNGFDNLLLHSTEGNMGGIRDYLTFICPRIVEMRKLMKAGASFYYVGFVFVHYLKCFLDTLFEQAGNNEIEHFKKEIIIEEEMPDNADFTMWQNTHRGSLYYSKGEPKTFNAPDTQLGSVWSGFSGRNAKEDDIPFRITTSNDLYDRWISASSNPGDIVLDAFCGSGTTLDSAQSQGRDWIGIDNAEDAIQSSIYRMWAKHSLVPVKDYALIFNNEKITRLRKVREFLKQNKLGVDFSDMFK